MKTFFKIALLLVLLAVGIWLWLIFFPPAEKVIRRRIGEVAHFASFEANEGALARVSNVSQLAGYFSPDAKIHMDAQETGQWLVSGREEIAQKAIAARSALSSLEVKFVDVKVEIGGDKESAVVETTARVTARGEADLIVQELQISFKKISGDWLITHVESVRTLQ